MGRFRGRKEQRDDLRTEAAQAKKIRGCSQLRPSHLFSSFPSFSWPAHPRLPTSPARTDPQARVRSVRRLPGRQRAGFEKRAAHAPQHARSRGRPNARESVAYFAQIAAHVSFASLRFQNVSWNDASPGVRNWMHETLSPAAVQSVSDRAPPCRHVLARRAAERGVCIWALCAGSRSRRSVCHAILMGPGGDGGGDGRQGEPSLVRPATAPTGPGSPATPGALAAAIADAVWHYSVPDSLVCTLLQTFQDAQHVRCAFSLDRSPAEDGVSGTRCLPLRASPPPPSPARTARSWDLGRLFLERVAGS